MLDRSGVLGAWLTSVCLLGCGGGGGGGPAGNGPALFFVATPVLLGLGSEPAAIAVADVDRDGLLDVVTALRGQGAVTVLLGDGFGGLTVSFGVPLGAGVDPAALALAPLDADGILDLAVADAANDAVLLFRGGGAGTFSFLGTVVLDAGSEPSAVVVADLDADGRTDLVVAERARSTVSVARGIGDGTFFDPESSSLGGGFRPEALVAGDFNRDGRIDVAASSGANGTIVVLRGLEDGSFLDPVTTTASSDAQLVALAAADLDRDGRLDLVTAGKTSGSVFVLLGNGPATFGPASAFPVGPQPVAVALGDFDRDGALDVAAAIFGLGGISVLLGRGDGTFGGSIRHGSGGQGGAGIALGDLDRNGSLDVACANARTGDLGIVLGLPHEADGAFDLGPRVPFGSGHDPEGGAIADVDRDGILDLLVASRGADALSVALGTGGGGFAAPFDVSLGTGSGPVAVATADFDRDGRLDVAVANAGASDVTVLVGLGNGDFLESDVAPMGGGADPSAIAVADLDRDGFVDVVVALRGLDRVAVALGNGDGTLEAAVPFDLPLGFEPQGVVVADFDRDGFGDVATVGPGSSSAAVLLSDPFLGLEPPILSSLGTGAEPADLVVLDAHVNGRLDLAVADRLGGAVVALLGFGDGSFLASPAAPAGSGPTTVATGDVDRDGLEDVVAARFAPDRARVLRGRGDGTFAQGVDVASGGDGPVRILVADLDLDGVLDLVLLHRTSDEAVVFLGS